MPTFFKVCLYLKFKCPHVLDNITDLLKLRPNVCPKVDQEVKIIVKVVKIIGEKNIPMYLRFCVVIVIS